MTTGAPQSEPRLPLHGVVVADFSRVLAGPLATMFLADLGATVIKVERPGSGDDTRAWGPPFVGELSTYFTSVNRNKRSIDLDLRAPDDLAVARQLADRADVLVENFRPGALRVFGLDDESARARNPGLVYCSISGFGSGSGAHLAGYDFVVQAVGGLMSVTGSPDGPPTKVGVALVDVLAGLHATIGIQAALRERDRTGRGQTVEINLLSSLLASLVNQGAAYLNGGGTPTRMGNQHPSIAPYETISTADGELAIAVGNDRQFQHLAEVIGRPALAADRRFATNPARVTHRVELVAALEEALRADTAPRWAERLRLAGVACGPVQDIAEAVALATSLGLAPIAGFPADQGLGTAGEAESGSANTRPTNTGPTNTRAANTGPTTTGPTTTGPINTGLINTGLINTGLINTGLINTMASPLGLSGAGVRYHRAPPRLGADSAEVRAWLSGNGELAN